MGVPRSPAQNRRPECREPVLSVVAELLLGVITLPFNLHHLGAEAYGLWMLTAGLTIHFSILDLRYGGAMVKFIAQYRAHKDTRR
jgi:O-antigen/teichoic acid export membrane protein